MALPGSVNDLKLYRSTYISLSSNFALSLQHYVMEMHHSGPVGHPTDLMQFRGHCDLYFMVQ